MRWRDYSYVRPARPQARALTDEELANILGRLKTTIERSPVLTALGLQVSALRNRFYLDELYEATFIRLHDLLAAIASWFDRWIIAGAAVRGAHGTTELVGRALRLLQTGNLQTYAFLFALGVALVLYLALK